MDLCKSSVTKPLVHFSNGNEEVEEGNRQKSIRQLILLRCRLIISCLCRVVRRRGRVGHFALPPRVNPPD